MKQPFYVWPGMRLKELLGTIGDAIRSLPDGQLLEEVEQLRAMGTQDHLPDQVLLRIYEVEQARRS